jgi:hypothetical protein
VEIEVFNSPGKECENMPEPRFLETTVKSFLIGVSVGTILATILKPAEKPRMSERDRDVVDIASEDSFPASDAPAY